MKYDVVIIGAGPAGIFAARELTNSEDISVALIDKGKKIEQRTCPSYKKGESCYKVCAPCDTMCGFGGAGAFSDGKLNIAHTLLGDSRLGTYFDLQEFRSLVQVVDDVWLGYGASSYVFGDENGEEIDRLYNECEHARLKLLGSRIRHLGTECASEILKKMQDDLEGKVHLMFKKEVVRIKKQNNKVSGVIFSDGAEINSDYVVAVPGRDGTGWFEGQCKMLELCIQTHPVDIGVRVEVPAYVMERFTSKLYEPKIFYNPPPFGDQVRTFCVCPHGKVTLETVRVDGKSVTSVNGHSFQNKKTDSTNFALLVKTAFTEPFHNPTEYAAHFAHAANLLAGEGVLVQRLGDILAGRRSTDKRIAEGGIRPTLSSAIPGDLSLALPYRQMTGIVETLRAMEKVLPGVFSMTNTLLYGLEVKYYSSSPKLSSCLETELSGLFAGGDGAGVSRNLVHACVSGMKIAKEIKIRRRKL